MNRWDKRYILLAKEISHWSKDPSTKIGSVIVGNHGQILSQGYNGFPRKLSDNPEEYENRTLKYQRVVHAEMNAIYNASLSGISLENSSIYIWGLPSCHECAKGIIQTGITKVVQVEDINERWSESNRIAEQFYIQCGIEILRFTPEQICDIV